jgi:hypothetical protein
LALIALSQSGNRDEARDLQDAIRCELESNPFWLKWGIEKITILDHEDGKERNPNPTVAHERQQL